MTRFQTRYATAIALVRSTLPIAADRDDTIQLACEGDRAAVNLVAHEHWALLLKEVTAVLGDRFAQDADDVVNDLFVAMLEREVPFARCRQDALPNLRIMARLYAEKHLRDACERWNVDPDEGALTG